MALSVSPKPPGQLMSAHGPPVGDRDIGVDGGFRRRRSSCDGEAVGDVLEAGEAARRLPPVEAT
jgi:hypothetical protein